MVLHDVIERAKDGFAIASSRSALPLRVQSTSPRGFGGRCFTIRIDKTAIESGNVMKVLPLLAALTLCSTLPTGSSANAQWTAQTADLTSYKARKKDIAPLGPRLAQIRQRAALTWEHLAAIIGVSRRAVHLWSAGGSITPANMEKITRLDERISEMVSRRPLAIRDRLFEIYEVASDRSIARTSRPQSGVMFTDSSLEGIGTSLGRKQAVVRPRQA